MNHLPYNDTEEEELWSCPQCDGWGFEIVMATQWEESNESPASCISCAGLGYVVGG